MLLLWARVTERPAYRPDDWGCVLLVVLVPPLVWLLLSGVLEEVEGIESIDWVRGF